jgi:hypothetical protein
MAIFSKQILSGSTNGAPIKVVATASTGTTIHATGTSASTLDEVWIYAYNSSSSTVVLTIQYGGTTTPDNDIRVSVPAQSGLTLVVPGLILRGTGSAATTIFAYAASANVITLSGYVNRIV